MEYRGLGAGRGYSALVQGTTLVSRPLTRKISQANSYQVHTPSQVAWKTPYSGRRITSMMSLASSFVLVGLPHWSFTTVI